MMTLFSTLPVDLESFAVVSQRLSESQLTRVVHEVYEESLVWNDDPRSWLSYGAFLGFQINKAMFTYQIGRWHVNAEKAREEVDLFVAACLNYAMEQGETL